jgi:cysteine-rich repeat protein
MPRVDSAEPWIAPGCGDGVVDPGEVCDNGEANSDTTPDACRTTCLPAACGDGVQDSDEACDDGNTVAADGCDPTCLTEDGLFEIEPNDRWLDRQEIGDARLVLGALDEGDIDCFSFDVSACGSVAATVMGECPGPVSIQLRSPDSDVYASGSVTESACAVLDPDTTEGARFLDDGAWSLCIASPTDTPMAAYSLAIEVLAQEDTDYELPAGQDPDSDGVPDRCDDDDDGDSIPDIDDLCPDVPDGPAAPPLQVSASGFIRTWLAAGPYTGTTSPDRCMPSEDNLVHATDDSLAVPAVATAAGTLWWTAFFSSDDRLEFLTDYGGVDAPREVYTAAWVRAPAGDATLALGPDDGVRAWLAGVEVLDVNGCQGTNIDQFQADVTFTGDWQLLLLKVRDNGGGWGNYARFLDTDGNPITTIEVALTPDGSPLPSTDTDGDGIGDACDPNPVE